MSQPISVAVFCGSQPGNNPAYAQAAAAFGAGLARAGMRLVYGAGRNGLMGVLADAALAGGGQVVGVIPDFLRVREVAHTGLTELIGVGSLHARKQCMFELSDAAVMLPGGLGTLDETLEMITWRQLGLHDRPIILCDIAGSATPLLTMLDAAITAGFAAPQVRSYIQYTPDIPATLALLTTISPARRTSPARL